MIFLSKVPAHLCDLGRSWGRLFPYLLERVLGFLSLGWQRVSAKSGCMGFGKLPEVPCSLPDVEEWGRGGP